jgi:hypothetical protein
MKKQLFTLIIALIAFSQSAFSQDVKIKFKKDTAFIDGKPICLCKDRYAGTEYRILTLKNRELLFAKAVGVGLKAYYNLTFLDSGAKCEREMGWKFGTGLVRDLYERGALTFDSDSLNPDGLKKFLMTNDHKFSEEFKATEKGADRKGDGDDESPRPKLVERNREATIFISGSNLIEQDFKKLGTYTMKDDANPGGIQTTLKIMDMDGNLVAEVIFKNLSDKTGDVYTFIDRRKHSFTSDKGHNGFPLAKDFAQFLIDKRYL